MPEIFIIMTLQWTDVFQSWGEKSPWRVLGLLLSLVTAKPFCKTLPGGHLGRILARCPNLLNSPLLMCGWLSSVPVSMEISEHTAETGAFSTWTLEVLLIPKPKGNVTFFLLKTGLWLWGAGSNLGCSTF